MDVPSAATLSPHFAREQAAELYREVMLPRIFEPWAEVLLEIAPPRAGDAVLDVATGPGTVARLAAARIGSGGRVTGVDVSAAMLAVGRGWPAEAGAAPIEYIESSAASMPLPDQSFDVAYCQQGLQHMTDPQAALREMHRLLKPNGRVAVAAWTESPFRLFRQIVARFIPNSARPSDFGHDAASLSEALGNAGFRNVAVHTRHLTATFEGGVSQAMRVAEGTSTGPVIAAMQEPDRQAVRQALREAVATLEVDGVVLLPSEAHIAVAAR